jgi:hypothetical protein
MAMFGLPGGAELWILLALMLGPLLLAAVVIWLTSRNARTATVQIPSSWLADPTGRHELRYWNGSAWTAHVSDAGVQSLDGG